MKVQLNALEARIVSILRDWYPITVEELRDELGLRADVLERTLKSLMLKGVLELEPLSDKTHIRLLSLNLDVSVDRGRKKKGKKAPKPSPAAPADDIMYR